jgi:hypothetical protein
VTIVPEQEKSPSRVERRAFPRYRVIEEREAEWRFRGVWEDMLRVHGDDTPEGPVSRSYRAAWELVDYWKYRALDAERLLQQSSKR